MKTQLAQLLLMGETKLGLLTKALQLEDDAKELNERVRAALDTFNGAIPEAIIPEGYVLVPDTLPSGTKAFEFKDAMGVNILDAKRIYANFIERFREDV